MRCGRALTVETSNAFLLLFLLAGEADLRRELASDSRWGHAPRATSTRARPGLQFLASEGEGLSANLARGECRGFAQTGYPPVEVLGLRTSVLPNARPTVRGSAPVAGRTHRNRSDYYLHKQVADIPMTLSMGGSEEMVSCTSGSGLVRRRSCQCS